MIDALPAFLAASFNNQPENKVYGHLIFYKGVIKLKFSAQVMFGV
jgi:hypothetical protein